VGGGVCGRTRRVQTPFFFLFFFFLFLIYIYIYNKPHNRVCWRLKNIVNRSYNNNNIQNDIDLVRLI
jgi:Ca2+-dependent lipid-binding protein